MAAILRIYNDNSRGEQRDDLYRYAAEAVGTRGDIRLQLRRAELALAWAAGQYRSRSRRVRAPRSPAADAGPDLIAEYVIRSVHHRRMGGRRRVEVHAAVVQLLDELIALGASDRLLHAPAQAGRPASVEPGLPPLADATLTAAGTERAPQLA